MKDKLIYKINGEEYLLMEILIASEEFNNKLERNMKKFGVIEQGVKEVRRRGFISSGFIITKVLVPTNKIKQWEDVFRDLDEK